MLGSCETYGTKQFSRALGGLQLPLRASGATASYTPEACVEGAFGEVVRYPFVTPSNYKDTAFMRYVTRATLLSWFH